MGMNVEKDVYIMDNGIILLHTGNSRNTVNQLCFN